MPAFPLPDESDGIQPAPFACRCRLEGRSGALVDVSGELDLATAGRLEDALRRATGAARLVLLDLHGVTFLDSAALHVILEATTRARSQGVRLVLAGASRQIDSLLDLTGTRAHLDVLNLPQVPRHASP